MTSGPSFKLKEELLTDSFNKKGRNITLMLFINKHLSFLAI